MTPGAPGTPATPAAAGTATARPQDLHEAREPAGPETDPFYRDLAAAQLVPLWRVGRDLLPPHPRPRAVPWLWRGSTLYPLGERAIAAVPVSRGGDRRVLSLVNPGLGGLPYAAGTLWGGIQCLGPGETAPAHRHTPGAIRFVLTGSGVWTTVNGDPCDMNAGDLVLTPSWHWHDHTNGTDQNMFWFDGLDLPMIEALDAIFFEPHAAFSQPVTGSHNQSERAFDGAAGRYAAGRVERVDPAPSPLLTYRWADTDAELSRRAAGTGEPMVSVEFASPLTGASVLPTLSCGMCRLLPGGTTLPVRRAGNAIYVVFRGTGESVVDGLRLGWSAGDIFVVPSWAALEHTSGEGADLFVLSDAPVLRALGIYREERMAEPQALHGTFP